MENTYKSFAFVSDCKLQIDSKSVDFFLTLQFIRDRRLILGPNAYDPGCHVSLGNLFNVASGQRSLLWKILEDYMEYGAPV